MVRASRVGRMGDILHRELSKLIRDELTDPRVGMITISSVLVSEDLSFAHVYVTVLEDDKQNVSLEALNKAAGFFRSQLSKHLTLRIVPKIRFEFDESLRTGSRMDMLLKSVSPADSHVDEDEDPA